MWQARSDRGERRHVVTSDERQQLQELARESVAQANEIEDDPLPR
jgi:hypothetical protein